MTYSKYYRTFIFDCDGVILDSNRIKTDTFRRLAEPYGKKVAGDFIAYHQNNGGLSRYQKFEYFFRELCQLSDWESKSKVACEEFGISAHLNLFEAPEIPGIRDFLSSISSASLKIVSSGGKEEEILWVFKKKDLYGCFDIIFGSPKSKKEHMEFLIKNQLIKYPAVFFGDSKLDFEVASDFGLDFVFLYGYTEFKIWKDYFRNRNVKLIKNFKELI